MTFRLRRGTLTTLDPREHDQDRRNARYWATRSPAERLAAVEFLRIQYSGLGIRLRRVLRAIDRAKR